MQKNCNILILDNNENYRNNLHMALSALKIHGKIYSSNDLLQGLSFISRLLPDIIFIDVGLNSKDNNGTKMNTLDFITRMDNIVELNQKRPLIIISTDFIPQKNILKSLHDKNIYDILPKNFNSKTIISLVSRLNKIMETNKILIVDDSATVRNIIKKVISSCIFQTEIYEASTGIEADNIVKQQENFDAIFMDFNMPGIDGLETAGNILYTHPNIAIVMMTNKKDSAIQRSAAHIGVSFFLEKPFNSYDVNSVFEHIFNMQNSRFSSKKSPFNFNNVNLDNIDFDTDNIEKKEVFLI